MTRLLIIILCFAGVILCGCSNSLNQEEAASLIRNKIGDGSVQTHFYRSGNNEISRGVWLLSHPENQLDRSIVEAGSRANLWSRTNHRFEGEAIGVLVDDAVLSNADVFIPVSANGAPAPGDPIASYDEFLVNVFIRSLQEIIYIRETEAGECDAEVKYSLSQEPAGAFGVMLDMNSTIEVTDCFIRTDTGWIIRDD